MSDPNDLVGDNSGVNTPPLDSDYDWLDQFNIGLFDDAEIQDNFEVDFFDNFDRQFGDIQYGGTAIALDNPEESEAVEEFNLDLLDQPHDDQEAHNNATLHVPLRTIRRSRQRLDRFKLETHTDCVRVHAKKLKAGADKGELHKEWSLIRCSKGKMQREEALRLTREAAVILPVHGCGLEEVAQYQRYLAREGCIIKIYSLKRIGKDRPVLYDGTPEVLDSLNYFHMALASLPKAFGLGDIAKGYFPHFFNNKENQDYVGSMPDEKYYGAGTMNVQAREKFLVWYNERVAENYEFNFRKEILHYCRLDVTILRRACVEFHKDKIQQNAGLRAVAKLCLNCLWGKFGERENLTKKAIIRTYEELAHIMFNPEIEGTGLVPVDNDTLFMSWKHLNEAAELSTKANVVIAAYTTAHARLKLYSYLEKQQERVLYYDTDSVIYVSDGKNELPLGNFLADLTDEVEGYGEGSFISSFVSGGPKFYTYRVKNDGSIAEVSKIKGVILNYETRKQIHYDSIRALVVDKAEPYQINYKGIRRTMYHDVITKAESKIIRVTGPK
nr:PREDICTED: uncharacterized protein LOC105272823 [Fopius arisanus]